ncbi:lanthionine synthetase C family protein [Dactylosporangium sp. NPDC048998]|uniref:lanthionine synthetase C family protein n=1 Tax=Dactylosporangium sp. NPDC048998 TaxID=3363976 RepID=UPI0037105585
MNSAANTDTNAGPAVLDGPDAARQSLATGTAGIALLHLEHAATGAGPWAEAHARIRAAATGPVDGGLHTGLYYGAPAIAFLLHRAAETEERYQTAAATLDQHVLRLARRRLTAAFARIHRGNTATLGEYDLLYGLTGIGALLLHRTPGSDTFADLLRYLTRLTENTAPLVHNGLSLPGWWAGHDPDPILPTPGGHANLGMAHGAAGILALLALAMRHGHVVDHHTEAIDRVTDWFDRWRQHDTDGTVWWPQWLTLDDLRTGRPQQREPGRPSWCYGTPGIARALQLAAIATNEQTRRAEAEHTLASCLTARRLDEITDPGLCHGLAGLYQTTYRAAGEGRNPALDEQLPMLAAAIQTAAEAQQSAPEAGLLTGRAGIQLAAATARHDTTMTGWDACLLII